MPSDEIILLHVIFKGLVQGIGFRRTILRRSEEFNLSGTVANLNDGSVEVFVQGEKMTCEKFINSLKNDSGLAKIEKIDINYLPIFKYNKFRII